VNFEKLTKPIPIVDLFAGPGGLGEGFSSLPDEPFRIAVSAEMDEAAHSTLRLRAFFRLLKRRQSDQFLQSYYQYCHGLTPLPYDASNRDIWDEAGTEAQRLTLGNPADNQKLDEQISKAGIDSRTPWVLIGGPPCQAYSLVGRARNRGEVDYIPEEDHRHFLYKEYLRILQKHRPAVFIMENVKGILSSSVGGQRIFHSILQDLTDPDSALKSPCSGQGYRIYSLSCQTTFGRGDDPASINAHDFVVKAEEHGIPQARHRVILMGIREDILKLGIQPDCLVVEPPVSVSDAIGNLPPLRSALSRQTDNAEQWKKTVVQHLVELEHAASLIEGPKMTRIREALKRTSQTLKVLPRGGLRVPKRSSACTDRSELDRWYEDEHLTVWLNHEARSHMTSDLRRYVYAAAFAEGVGRSPKGHQDFTLDGLRPNHDNWESGKFADRFRVQLGNLPATTVTSHISKDGHYFIHFDPSQCRSLTVREAARLQTFPDNYFFQGNRTQQYHQVGNAVPPLLANKIAKIVQSFFQQIGQAEPRSTLRPYEQGKLP
jgi:DNA (cytosine-5)-methyltransferase 1